MQRIEVSSDAPLEPGYYETECRVQGNAYRLDREQSAAAVRREYGDAVQLIDLITVSQDRIVIQYVVRTVDTAQIPAVVPLIIRAVTLVAVVFGVYQISVIHEKTTKIIFGDNPLVRILWPAGFAVLSVAALVWVVKR